MLVPQLVPNEQLVNTHYAFGPYQEMEFRTRVRVQVLREMNNTKKKKKIRSSIHGTKHGSFLLLK